MRTKFKLGQEVYAFFGNQVVHGRVDEIKLTKSKIVYRILSATNHYDVSETYIATSVKKLAKNVIGEDYLYWTCIEDFVKNHSVKEK